MLRPNSSEALYRLGNGQLDQYDATNEARWLRDAELSFRASLNMEGKAIQASVIPSELKEQDWWKNKDAKAEKPPATTSKATGAAAGAKKPGPGTTTTNRAGAGARQQPGGNKQPPPARQPAAGRGKPGVAPTTSRTGAGGGRGTATTGASKVGGAGARKPPGTDTRAGAGKSGQGVKTNTRAPTTGKSVATLGELKAGNKPNTTANTKPAQTPSSQEVKVTVSTSNVSNTSSDKSVSEKPSQEKVEMNCPSYQARLGLARTLIKTEDEKKQDEAYSLYREVMKMSPNLHDAYIELGDVLAKKNPKEAVDVYSKFPFQDPPTFDDAFLHGEIIRLLMKSEDYDNPHLCSSMIAMGKALGIGVLEKQVAILEGKFKSPLLKSVYAGVHGKPVDDPELKAFFKFKCWL